MSNNYKFSKDDVDEIIQQVANVGQNVPKTWADRDDTITNFVTNLVNQKIGGVGPNFDNVNLNIKLKSGEDPTALSSYQVKTAGIGSGTPTTLDKLVDGLQTAGTSQNKTTDANYSTASSLANNSLPENPDTGVDSKNKTDENQLSSLSEKIFWAAYDILNTTDKDKYRWDTQTEVSLPGTNIQNISVDLAALLEVLPEANKVVARSLPSNSGMGAGIAIQDASDSLKSVLNLKEKQNGGSIGTRPIETSTGLLMSSYENTWEDSLDVQMTKSPKAYNSEKDGFDLANREQVKKYMDPDNYNQGNAKYQFLDLTTPAGISEQKLAQFLKGKGILEGMARVFIEAAKESKINVAYLVAHACVETRYGTSPFATGREYNGKTVYNMFGYAAYDTSPSDAKEAAYNNKWFSPEAAVRGGAKTIAKNYIYNNQNTLYKIRWNPASPGTHQYATDISWAVTIASIMGKIYGYAPNRTTNLDIPMY